MGSECTPGPRARRWFGKEGPRPEPQGSLRRGSQGGLAAWVWLAGSQLHSCKKHPLAKLSDPDIVCVTRPSHFWILRQDVPIRASVATSPRPVGEGSVSTCVARHEDPGHRIQSLKETGRSSFTCPTAGPVCCGLATPRTPCKLCPPHSLEERLTRSIFATVVDFRVLRPGQSGYFQHLLKVVPNSVAR